MTARFIAQRTLTGEFLDWDLPLSDDRYVRELSGPGLIEGTVNPELAVTLAGDGLPVLTEWDTALFVEIDGEIRAGGIVTNLEYEGSSVAVTAAGYAVYPHGIPYVDNYLPVDWSDPAQVVRDLWQYVQSFPDADLGVNVTGDTTWMRVRDGGGGPFRIFSYEVRDIGEEIDSMIGTGPMDFLEKHTWAGEDRTAINHTIEIGFPRIGRRREDLRFAGGENIAGIVPFVTDGLEYAQDVYGFGEGEGAAMVQARIATPNGRVRRVATYFDKTADKQRLIVQLRAEHLRRTRRNDIREVAVLDHPNAPIGAIRPGDDILIQDDVPWLGHQQIWSRVISVEQSTQQPDRAVLQVQRTDTFRYAPVNSPTGEPMPVDLGSEAGGLTSELFLDGNADNDMDGYADGGEE